MLIEERPRGDGELQALLDAAFAELVARYGPEGRSGVDPAARFLVAVADGAAVACGALQPVDAATGEVKRMYVRPSHRGRGAARALLKALEALAAATGYERVRLTTGIRQPEAIALYESSGYTPIAAYGKYVGEPTSRSYGKELGR
ncbi:GNAT family N-acetyltransferase [Nonomuraea mangrovi]|uniref:GNAT family N-acetyltransferase n=1 Tax=Nonomuraea mangrovi TaxID=2316207 RepID=A0ABW4SZD6_9ACTN